VKFGETPIPGAYLIELEPSRDARGSFARTWCRREFAAHSLSVEIAECGTSFNRVAGTLRGLHYQTAPYQEEKLVRCTRGAIFDVVVDLRPASPAYARWFAAELTSSNGRMMAVPAGCAHGFLTLEDETDVFYQMSQIYHPASARGVRWDDPTLAIRWPGEVPRIISDADRSLPFMDGRQLLAAGSRSTSHGQKT
jgi:dTDP-4-dehydrorhamnose 3,5-epimerase